MNHISREVNRRFAILYILVFLLTTVGMVGCWRSAAKDPRVGGMGQPSPIGTVTSKGGTYHSDGATLVFPAGAVTGDVPLAIHASNQGESEPDQNMFFASKYYQLEADGRPFAADVQVTLPYDPARLPPGFDESNLRPMWWNGRVYQPVIGSQVDLKRHEVTFLARHFSDYVSGGEKAKAVPPSGWQRQRPDLPVEILVVETYQSQVSPEYLDSVESTLAYAYEHITDGKPYHFLRPGLTEGGKLVVTITDLHSQEAGRKVMGKAVTPTQLLIKYDLSPSELRHTIVHEFFHCVQFTHYDRALRAAKTNFAESFDSRFIWLDEATAEWMAYELVPGQEDFVSVARADFCFEELCYHSQVGKRLEGGIVRPGSEQHQYASAIFIKYLVNQYGDALLPSLLDAAYGPAYYRMVELLDEEIRKAAQKAGRGNENLYSTYAHFVLEHVYAKDSFDNWDTTRWKMGPHHQLNLPSAGDRRPAEVKLGLDQEFKDVIDGRSCQVSKVLTFSSVDSSRDRQLELTLAPVHQGRTTPAMWLHAFTQFRDGDLPFPKAGTPGHITIDLDAGVNQQVIVLPASLDGQPLTLTAKLSARKATTFDGNWAGKSTIKGSRLGPLDYIARISHQGENWSVRCGDLSTVVYASDVQGGKVIVKGNQLNGELIDKTISEGQTTRFSLTLTQSGNQLAGKETCEDDGRIRWEKEFTLYREP